MADTYVIAERPTQANGADTRLTAANWSNWHTETYVRFDVPAAPVDRPIAAARIEFSFDRLDHQPRLVELRSVFGAWDELTTYANRPAVGAVAAAESLPGNGTATVSFDVTAALSPDGGAYSFALTNPTTDSVASVRAREHGAGAPRLILEYGQPTLCGAAFNPQLPGETYQQALARTDGAYNGLESVRVFYPGLPKPWPGKIDTAGRPMIISFKAPPAEVIAGTHDAALRQWFATVPDDLDVYWTYFHEPENEISDGVFTAEQFRLAWRRVAGLAHEAGDPGLRATLILMDWSVNPASGRNWRDYYPGRDVVDVLAWDVYNQAWRDGRYAEPASMFARVIAANQAENLPLAIAETGSGVVAGDDGTARAGWLRRLVRHLVDSRAVFVAYFDLDWSAHSGPDYRLRDPASMAIWREFCS